MDRIRKWLHQSLSFLDYVLFIILFMFKMYLFAKFTDTVFVSQGVFGYIQAVFKAIIGQESLENLQKGLVWVSLGAAFLLSFWTLFLKPAARILTLSILNLFVSVIAIADLIYFRYFHDVISVPVLLQAGQVDSLGGSISNLFRITDLLILADLIVTIPLAIYYFIKMRKRKGHTVSLVPRLASGAILFVLGMVLATTPVNTFIAKWGQGLFLNNWSNVSVYNVTGLMGFHARDVFNYVNDFVINSKKIPEEEVDDARAWFNEHQKELAKKTPFFGTAKGKNVIIFQAEAFQNFVIGQKINGKEITPNLNALIKESIYFENYYHQVGQGRTSDAEFLSNMSLHPLPSGSVYIRYPNNVYDSLPGTLKENGYATAAFHSYEPSFWNRYLVYENIGFDRFYSEKDFVLDEKVGWAVSDESLFRQSLEKMKEMEKPFYAFIIGLSSHHPFTIPGKYKTLDLGEYEGTDFGNYLHSMHYVDYAIGKMVEMLKAEGLWDESIFVVYGDHDSGTMRDGGEMASFVGKSGDPFTFVQMQNQVPLLIHLPGNIGAGVYTKAAGQLDLAPTLLHLLGISTEDKFFMGDNLLADQEKLVVFRYGSFTDGKIFYKASLDGIFENGTCYDAKTGQEIGIDACRPLADQAKKELKISDNVIYGNLLKSFKEQTIVKSN